MFRTIFTVTKIVSESTHYRAHFEDFAEAKKFAESEIEKVGGEHLLATRHYLDGSFFYDYFSVEKPIEIHLDDFAWITDFRFSGLGFYDNTGLLIGNFESMDTLREFFKRSRKIS